MRKQKFFLTSVFFMLNVSEAFSVANCPSGTTLNIDCWSCGETCTAYLSNIKDDAGNDVKISRTGTTAQKLTVTGSGKMNSYGWGASTAPWQAYTDSVTDIEVNGIKKIGNSAFRNMYEVKNIELSDTVEEIGDGSFFENTALKSIHLPDSVKILGDSAFSDCPNLKDVILSENLLSIERLAFANTKFTEIVIPETVQYLSEDAFGALETANGAYYSRAKVITLYCNEALTEQCEAALQFRKDLGADVRVVGYQMSGNQIFHNNRFYNSANDILSGNYDKKRIYTIDEANRASGKKNTFKIRYK